MVGLTVVSLLAVAWLFGNQMTRPWTSETRPAAPPAQDFRLAAADGISLAATYYPGRAANSPGVLLLHGNHASRGSLRPISGWLSGQGFAVLAIDFRGHGQSTQTERSFGLFESRDAEAAFAWLKARQQGAPVGVIGISLGGAAALLGDQGPLAAEAMVLTAVYPDIRRAVLNRLTSLLPTVIGRLGEPLLSFQSLFRFGVAPSRISPAAAVARYKGAVMVIGGGADAYTPPDETREMLDAAAGPKSLWIVDGLDHVGVSGLDNGAYRARVGAFLRQWLGLP